MATFPAVGMLARLRPGISAADLTAAAAMTAPMAGPSVAGIVSPWAPPNSLASVVWADVFGTRLVPLTREEAMRVPAMARARHVVCGTVARVPLRGYRGATVLTGADAPSWIESTSGPLSPFHRMIWTCDDLLFYGWSCWSRRNSVADGFPLQADRLPMGRWTFDDAGRVLVDNLDGAGFQLADQRSIILIPGPHEGLLTHAAGAIRHAADLQRAASRAARHPAANLALKQTGGTPLTRPEIEQLIADWSAAREGENGGVAYLNQSIEAQELGTFDRHLVVEGRNAAAVDIARHASLPADLVDAAGSESSLTYSTTRDNDRRAVDYGVGMFMSSISGALSQDAVTPRGQRVAFDLEEWLEGAVPGQTPPAPAPAAAPGIVPSIATPGAAAGTTGETPQ